MFYAQPHGPAFPCAASALVGPFSIDLVHRLAGKLFVSNLFAVLPG